MIRKPFFKSRLDSNNNKKISKYYVLCKHFYYDRYYESGNGAYRILSWWGGGGKHFRPPLLEVLGSNLWNSMEGPQHVFGVLHFQKRITPPPHCFLKARPYFAKFQTCNLIIFRVITYYYLFLITRCSTGFY